MKMRPHLCASTEREAATTVEFCTTSHSTYIATAWSLCAIPSVLSNVNQSESYDHTGDTRTIAHRRVH